MFEKYNIKTTWFIPGHSLETFPEECRMIADAGHEIGLHGYSHENPVAMTLEQQTAIMDKVRNIPPIVVEFFKIAADRFSDRFMPAVLQPHHRVPTRQTTSRHRGSLVSHHVQTLPNERDPPHDQLTFSTSHLGGNPPKKAPS